MSNQHNKTSGQDDSGAPMDRSHYSASGTVMESIPKFEVGKSAWITLPRKGSIEVKIDSRMKDASGKFIYQVKDAKSGMLHKGGVWVAQENLSEF